MSSEKNFSKMKQMLKEYCGVSDQTIDVVCNINGWTEQSLEDILYAVTGYTSFEQLEDA